VSIANLVLFTSIVCKENRLKQRASVLIANSVLFTGIGCK
jgi:hypothetical protein